MFRILTRLRLRVRRLIRSWDGEYGEGLVGATPQVASQFGTYLVFLPGVSRQGPPELLVEGAAVQIVGGLD
jgi:hypothetical protein